MAKWPLVGEVNEDSGMEMIKDTLSNISLMLAPKVLQNHIKSVATL